MKIPSPSRRAISFGACGLLLAFAIAAHAARAADRIVPGKWEAKMTTDGDSNTVSFCIGPEEAAAINGGTASARAYAEKKAHSSQIKSRRIGNCP